MVYNICMIKVMLVVFAAMLGAAFGSFACCQAWRIRLKETKEKDLGKRSVCLTCGKKLTWYENIPIVSWLLQRGRCRKCGKKIGYAEILAEVFGAISFGLIVWSFITDVSHDLDFAGFIDKVDVLGLVTVLIALVGLLILAVYDGKWGEMPTMVLTWTIAVCLIFAVVEVVRGSYVWIPCPEGSECVQAGFYRFDFEVLINSLLPVLGSVAILAGTYYLLYVLSKERLVGGGDWLLCLAIGLLLRDWRLALVELFLANFLGSLVMLPRRKEKIAFGPFLVIGFVIVFVLKDWLFGLLLMR